MAKTTKKPIEQNKKKGRKKKLHMKKSVRLTVAALMMVTALIVALIPVQGGGVKATTEATLPNVNELSLYYSDPANATGFAAGSHALLGSAADGYAGFAMSSTPTTQITGTAIDTTTYPNADLAYLYDSEEEINDETGKRHKYHKVVQGEDKGFPGEPVPVFKLAKDNTGSINVISKYIGAGAYVPPTRSISLSDAVAINMGKALSTPYYSGDKPLIKDVRDDHPTTPGRFVDGEYTKYTESDTIPPSGKTYSLVRVDVESHKITLKKDADGNLVEKIPGDPTQGYDYDDEADSYSFYACKDSADTANDSLINTINYIADCAFYNEQDIYSIDIPERIRAIGNAAFKSTGLKNVTISTQCKFIGDQAFESCGSLESVKFSDDQSNIEFIGDGCFANSTLKSFKIPKANNLTIGSGAFLNCKRIDDIDFSNTNPKIKLGCYCFAGCYGNDESGVPHGLTNVQLTNVGKIVSHNTGDTVGCGIFSNCNNLYTVEFSDSLSGELPYGTFANCSNMYYVKAFNPGLSFHVDSTGKKHEFSDMGNNFHIWGPEYPCAIGTKATDNAVTYRYDLQKGDKFIYFDAQRYAYTFSPDGNGKYKITNIDDEKVLFNPGEYTDYTINIPYSVCDYYDIGGIGLNAGKTLDKGVKNIKIPDSIGYIEDRAFADIPSLEKVLFVSNIDSQGNDVPQADSLTIGAHVFANDKNLTDVYFRHFKYSPADGTVIDNAIDPNIVSVGVSTQDGSTNNRVFDTTRNPGSGQQALTVHGRMYDQNSKESDPLFLACMDKDTGYVSSAHDGYVYYTTDGPELLSAKYDVDINEKNGAASLVNYPTKDTKVMTGIMVDSSGKPILDAYNMYTYQPEKTVTEVIQGLQPNSPNYNYAVKENFEQIFVPKGITSLENTEVKYGSGEPNERYFQNLKATKDANDGDVYTSLVTLASVTKLPDKAFATVAHDTAGTTTPPNKILPASTINRVNFLSDMWDIGNQPFVNSKNLVDVVFSADENPQTDTAGIQSGNKSYRTVNGIIYDTEYHVRKNPSDNHMDETLVECLPGTSGELTPEKTITRIDNGAFENCDKINSVDLTECKDLTSDYDYVEVGGIKKEVLHAAIPDRCFYDADRLSNVYLPDTANSVGSLAFSPAEDISKRQYMVLDTVRVRVPSIETPFAKDSFEHNGEDGAGATLVGLPDSAAYRYAMDPTHPNVAFESLGAFYMVTFVDYDGKILSQEKVKENEYIQNVPKATDRKGYDFVEWATSTGKKPTEKVTSDMIFVPTYKIIDDSSSSSSSTSTTASGSSGGSSSGGSSSGSSSASSSSSSRSSSSSSSSSSRPIVVSGAPAPYEGSGTGNINNNGGSGSGSGSGSNVAKGNADVTSSVNGLRDTGKMSATVNGSSENYIIKITETEEADACAEAALLAEFGSLDAIRYVPFDISLYDSTGTQKISPVPEGVTVSITMPIPDDLTIYGGNAKVGSTRGNNLEKIQPKFTVIDGVPCMNYTVSHLSPYVVYVDTAHLADVGIADATPQTGDPIHPKWFLVIGLAAVSILLFLKRDKIEVKAA